MIFSFCPFCHQELTRSTSCFIMCQNHKDDLIFGIYFNSMGYLAWMHASYQVGLDDYKVYLLEDGASIHINPYNDGTDSKIYSSSHEIKIPISNWTLNNIPEFKQQVNIALAFS